MERSDQEQEPSDSQKTAEKQIRDFASRKPAAKWDTELVILFYILSVSLDPLLLYSLILNDDRKCVVVDTKLGKIAIVLRSLADLSFIGHIIYEISGEAKHLRKEIPGLSTSDMVRIGMTIFRWQLRIPMAILAALPVPQMAILVFFPMLRASRAVNRMRIMNSLILLQYVPRIYPIYRDCKNLNKKKLDNYISDLERKTWVPGLLNFILYILASHVFGAFWYFFSIQRQIECWGYACQSGNGYFPRKVLQCFSWGVRNLRFLSFS
ncbi:cyclic nucleotide-gated ion channel 1-like isoform X2 [Prunus avium]|uniref:Cyclic nucleotide-gated ion channel 1-like isoform X2 n=1 Tax=Prunus avium TaxID=42229 RepID=A0A6P5U2C4_PRUAV|nr:cyclic nucleotide-gated ion channel 1-like isoform X2 [Prunus avium]